MELILYNALSEKFVFKYKKKFFIFKQNISDFLDNMLFQLNFKNMKQKIPFVNCTHAY